MNTLVKDKSNKDFSRNLAKITFPIERSESTGPGTETLWAEALGGEQYRLDNSPFYVYEVSYNDVVFAKQTSEILLFQRVRKRGGHSTYRIFLTRPLDEQEFQQYWKPFGSLGCTYEGKNKRLIAIDVPPTSDIRQVYALLERGEDAKLWEFEEGHCGHSLKRKSGPC